MGNEECLHITADGGGQGNLTGIHAGRDHRCGADAQTEAVGRFGGSLATQHQQIDRAATREKRADGLIGGTGAGGDRPNTSDSADAGNGADTGDSADTGDGGEIARVVNGGVIGNIGETDAITENGRAIEALNQAEVVVAGETPEGGGNRGSWRQVQGKHIHIIGTAEGARVDGLIRGELNTLSLGEGTVGLLLGADRDGARRTHNQGDIAGMVECGQTDTGGREDGSEGAAKTIGGEEGKGIAEDRGIRAAQIREEAAIERDGTGNIEQVVARAGNSAGKIQGESSGGHLGIGGAEGEDAGGGTPWFNGAAAIEDGAGTSGRTDDTGAAQGAIQGELGTGPGKGEGLAIKVEGTARVDLNPRQGEGADECEDSPRHNGDGVSQGERATADEGLVGATELEGVEGDAAVIGEGGAIEAQSARIRQDTGTEGTTGINRQGAAHSERAGRVQGGPVRYLERAKGATSQGVGTGSALNMDGAIHRSITHH